MVEGDNDSLICSLFLWSRILASGPTPLTLSVGKGYKSTLS